MEAYRFNTVAENGVIALPQEFMNKLVEITVCEIAESPIKKRELLSPIRIDTSGWKWNREEANERR
ncbi:MAG: hypothetical protein FWG90_07515 [Oscillospiraceae bacterium]|nr:hypothetical protein [Oscillospiraceae bacterium]